MTPTAPPDDEPPREGRGGGWTEERASARNERSGATREAAASRRPEPRERSERNSARPRLEPAVAAVRLAVRVALRDLEPARPVLAACSGGADSLALAGALAFEAPKAGRRAGAVTVDHGLQDGSAGRAIEVAGVLRGLGLDPVEPVKVSVGGDGGPEAAARTARYEVLDDTARRLGAVVLLGHTRNDQAETVLLGLARGSGARSLAGMPPVFDRGEIRYVRPLLELDRATTRTACLAMGLDPWDDPHNEDPAFTRVRVRHDALPVLEKALGPGVTEALARTARLLREDAEALDTWAERALADARRAGPAGVDTAGAETDRLDTGGLDTGGLDTGPDTGGLDVAALERLPRAVRTRVLRQAAIAAGSPPGTLAAVHVDALDLLVTGWRGQRHVDLPGGVRGFRRYGRLLFGRSESG
ncbi:tRNA lysidine(34) synthetase TilS [Actinomadura sp. HBU206391]|uniref:tRNA lysidine(34) synthetase TilS n=1 Tax=Actinomadura sp. HBU206391 TaxID=2731692 RepID=UPI00164F5E04|nr:tRNA lysidine(34) synthetase TilS [Actinomadura sp. HBU206391]MBC6458867.1 tRNA lysidine(34) synthetase TilS [Actinomadura sp. HBU206391]